jgi:hypothetical protein
MTFALISGASVSAGVGLDKGSLDSSLFVNRLIIENLNYSLNQIDNISVVGIDNKRIFLDTALKIITKQYTHVFVCWQCIPRINIDIDLEVYQTTVPIISPTKIFRNIDLVTGQRFTASKLSRINEDLLRYHSVHWEILDLIKYINILWYLAQTTNTKLHFINYSLCWDTDYFQRIEWQVSSDLTYFTQEILQSELRDDQESAELYSMIHSQYDSAGGIKEELWLNLYQSLHQVQVDTISTTDLHPGIKSQDKFVELLTPILNQKLR